MKGILLYFVPITEAKQKYSPGEVRYRKRYKKRAEISGLFPKKFHVFLPQFF
jgi:hypothetical protein